MKQKENIFEELNKMKNLISIKRGVVISEQEIIKEIGFGAYAYAQQQQQKTPSGYNLTNTQTPATSANYFNYNYKPYDFGQNSGMLVDCAKVYQFTIDMPSAQMQQDFAKKSGLNPKSTANFPYFCSGKQMAAKLAEINKSTGVQKTNAPSSNYSQSVGNYTKGVQKAIGTQETGKISSADLDKIIVMLGGEEVTDKSVELPKRADGQIDLDKVIADLEK